MNVLVVEDDERVADSLQRGLAEEGHEVAVVGTVSAALTSSSGRDMLIVDRGLPDGDGLDLVRALRARGDVRPILVLTARDRVGERVDGLLSGADDYLTKPFAFAELVARLKVIERRLRQSQPVITVDDVRLDIDAQRVWRGAEEVVLTPQELRLLRCLMEHRGRVLSRAKLLEEAWDVHHDPGTNIVDVYVGYLRNKIDAGRERSLIRTVRGLGYVIEASA